jgi:hypothetical protein
MPIVVGVSSASSSVGNYSGLIQSIIDTLKDDTLEDRVPDFIFRAEAMFNREIYPLNDETSTSLTLAEGATTIALPDDFKKLRTLTYPSTSGSVVLPQLSPDDWKARFLDATAAPPEAFALAGNLLWVGPEADTDYTLSLTYVQGLTNLSQSNQTNWLIEAHPDLYFFGTLMYAEIDGWNDERATNFAQTTIEILGRIKFWDAQRRRGESQGSVAGTYF